MNVFKKIDDAPVLDFKTIFSESVVLYKKTWFQGLVLQLLVLIIMSPIIIIFYLPFVNMVVEQQNRGYQDISLFLNFFESMTDLYVFSLILGVAVLGTVSVSLHASFFRMMKKIDDDNSVTLADFFYFTKSSYLIKLFKLALFSVLIVVSSALLLYMPLIYFLVPLSFLIMVFTFNKQGSFSELVIISFRLGHKKWLLTLVLLLVSYLTTTIASMLTFGFGSLFLTPFMYHPLYTIYKKVVGFDTLQAAS